MMKIETKCPAKINLYLKVLEKMNDHYHQIETSFQYIDLYDEIHFEKRKTGISIDSNVDFLKDDQNTIYAAANKLMSISNKNFGAHIQINKNIPIGAGLGGGSSNAASTLVALNKLWELNLNDKDLFNIGKSIGADVPFFLFGKNAIGKGVGDQLQKTSSLDGNLIIIDPCIHNSTKKMFNLLDEWKSNNKHAALSSQNHFWNVFLETNTEIRKFYFEIDNLYNLNLSGSGSCMFLIYKEKTEADKIIKKIPSNWRFFFCKPLQYSPICYIR